MKNSVVKIVSMILVCVLCFGSVTAYASEVPNTTVSTKEAAEYKNAFQTLADISNKSVKVVDAARITEIKTIVNESIDNGDFCFHFDNSAILDFNNATVLDIQDENYSYTSITIPVKGTKYSLISNVTFLMDETGLVTYSETLLTEGENNKFVIDTYYNGILVKSQNTEIDFVPNDEMQQALNTLQNSSAKIEEYKQTRGTAEVGACLAAILGVNAAVGLAIASTCFASCPAVPAICAACIGGVVALGSADVAAVVGCFNLA